MPLLLETMYLHGNQAEAQNEQSAADKEAAKETVNHEDTAAFHARIKEQQIQEHMRHMSREEKETRRLIWLLSPLTG